MRNEHLSIFILGRYPELSTQEIKSVFKQRGIFAAFLEENQRFLLVQTPQKLTVEDLNKTLGGTVKIGKITYKMPLPLKLKRIEEYLTSDSLFIDIIDQPKQKITFGISYYADDEEREKNQNRSLIPTLLTTLKDHLKAQGFTVRFPRHEGPFLSSASVEKNKLLSDGAEILIIQTSRNIFIGKTVAVQEFESFSQRDYGRPVRDMESGIMPPKIARMMINLAEQPQTALLLDPFCGSGTILQEALLLGYTNLTGTDISAKAVVNTKKNIAWLKEKKRLTTTPKILVSDVANLPSLFEKNSFHAIVTEPYMGPNFKSKPEFHEVKRNKNDLENLYVSAWKAFARVLRPGGVVVMIFPIFHCNNQYLSIAMLDKVASLGFKQVPLSSKQRHSIIVGNQYDFVLREIVKFCKV